MHLAATKSARKGHCKGWKPCHCSTQPDLRLSSTSRPPRHWASTYRYSFSRSPMKQSNKIGMSAIGPKQICRKTQSMSLLGVKRTRRGHQRMSAYDPKRSSFCIAQVTHRLNLGIAIKVTLTAPRGRPNLNMFAKSDAEVCMVPPGQNAATTASANVRALA